ncbi:MAG TPA: alpha-L-fucosidase [Gemmatimonadaceae bacterium]
MSTEPRDPRLAWWREARFGMFIHWGAYAVPAGTYKGERIPGLGEWIMSSAKIPLAEYEEIVRRFNPARFDADDWVRAAKNAGMKYIVITAKHHDGFALFDSKVSSYDIVDATPYHHDVIRELATAAHRHGLRFGAYYSIMDWHHPDAKAPNFARYVERYMKPQLRELITQYPEIDILWFDGEKIAEWSEARGEEMYEFVRALEPSLIINDRVGVGDFRTPQQEVPPQGPPGVDWETCMTMNGTWGFKSYDDDWKDTRTLLRTLIDAASKGGNFLLNVGPTGEGTLPDPISSRLAEMGAWMHVNGEAIYGTTVSPYGQPAWGRYTAKGNRVYAHVFDWPKDGRLEVAAAPTRAYLLVDKQSLNMERTGTTMTIHVPAVPPSTIASVVVLEFA